MPGGSSGALVLALAASLALCGCEPAQQADAKKAPVAPAGETAGQAAGDSAIIARVTAALLADKSIQSTDIHVDSFEGRVILRGVAPDQEQIAAAGRAARGVPGVKSVDNRLVVN